MAIEPNKQSQQQGSSGASNTQSSKDNVNGIVTVNDDNNPTPEQRDAQIPNELGTERLRSERQSVQEGKRSD
jgi:hypothetical protein